MTLQDQAQQLYDSGCIDDSISIIDTVGNRAYGMQDTETYHNIEAYMVAGQDVSWLDMTKHEQANCLRVNLMTSCMLVNI